MSFFSPQQPFGTSVSAPAGFRARNECNRCNALGHSRLACTDAGHRNPRSPTPCPHDDLGPADSISQVGGQRSQSLFGVPVSLLAPPSATSQQQAQVQQQIAAQFPALSPQQVQQAASDLLAVQARQQADQLAQLLASHGVQSTIAGASPSTTLAPMPPQFHPGVQTNAVPAQPAQPTAMWNTVENLEVARFDITNQVQTAFQALAPISLTRAAVVGALAARGLPSGQIELTHFDVRVAMPLNPAGNLSWEIMFAVNLGATAPTFTSFAGVSQSTSLVMRRTPGNNADHEMRLQAPISVGTVDPGVHFGVYLTMLNGVAIANRVNIGSIVVEIGCRCR